MQEDMSKWPITSDPASAGITPAPIRQRPACPNCYCRLGEGRVSTTIPIRDRYGRTTRQSYIWCENCRQGYELIEFLAGDTYKPCKWRYIYYLKDNWIQVQSLPEPAPVVTGPGGDYDRSIEPDVNGILGNIKDILHSAAESIGCLLDYKNAKNDRDKQSRRSAG